MEKKNNINTFFADFLIGGASAAISKTAVAPLDRLILLSYTNPRLVDMWKGNTKNVIRYFPVQALNFAFKDQLENLFSVPSSSFSKKLINNFTAGAIAGSLSLSFVYPLDMTRVILATSKSKGVEQFSGLLDAYKKTVEREGIQRLYKGFSISLLGISIYRGMYFGLYDSLKSSFSLSPSNNFYSAIKFFVPSFFLAWGTTIIAGVASYPVDTVRRRMMMSSAGSTKYKSSVHAFSQIIKNEGAASLFKGAGASAMRGISGALVLVLYDQLQAIFKH